MSNAHYTGDLFECYTFRLTLALPSAVFAPVDRSHGFQLRISSACRARRKWDVNCRR